MKYKPCLDIAQSKLTNINKVNPQSFGEYQLYEDNMRFILADNELDICHISSWGQRPKELVYFTVFLNNDYGNKQIVPSVLNHIVQIEGIKLYTSLLDVILSPTNWGDDDRHDVIIDVWDPKSRKAIMSDVSIFNGSELFDPAILSKNQRMQHLRCYIKQII